MAFFSNYVQQQNQPYTPTFMGQDIMLRPQEQQSKSPFGIDRSTLFSAITGQVMPTVGGYEAYQKANTLDQSLGAYQTGRQPITTQGGSLPMQPMQFAQQPQQQAQTTQQYLGLQPQQMGAQQQFGTSMVNMPQSYGNY